MNTAISNNTVTGRAVVDEPTIKNDVDGCVMLLNELIGRMGGLRERCGIGSSTPPSAQTVGQIHPDGLRSRVIDLQGNLQSAHNIMSDLERIA